MNGVRTAVTAKFGPLPVWAWAAIALALIVGYMYWKKIGFFAPASPADTSSQGSTQGSGMTPDFPLGMGGLGGNGDPNSPLARTQVVPSMFDPGTLAYSGQDSSAVGPIQGPSVNYDNFGGGGGGAISNAVSAAQNLAANTAQAQPISYFNQFALGRATTGSTIIGGGAAGGAPQRFS